ncbi:hypothetical protein DL546_008355 [Coniochaeta pulveracea]|uniref:Cell wall proline rich protein n=1 Tax=Coniochaeta pulveracea TaxID=177199 RepID=A0A420YFE9_9PEZI|nr:hypothetical protein DL546_008355 [Coniochaeta pulveracea]
MAATVGPGAVMDSFTFPPNAATQPQHINIPSAAAEVTSSISPSASPQLASRTPPLPNPPFVFPARSGISSSAPSSYSRASGRRPRASLQLTPVEGSARTSVDDGYSPFRASLDVERRPPGAMTLPAFSFPMAPAPIADGGGPRLSPPQSPLPPASPRAVPNRPPTGHGHRRGASEFVGGSIRGGDSITVQSSGGSPTKAESGHASPTLKPSAAARRHARGHSHKRSGAISSHDLSSIMLPPKLNNSGMKAGSAPPSPAVFDYNKEFSFPMGGADTQQQAQPVEHATSEDHAGQQAPTDGLHDRESSPLAEKPPTRVTKVGFSDTLEFIPRPLSLVSNETTSTANTIRPSHSASGSITSLISLTLTHSFDRAASPPLSAPATMMWTEERPSTAGGLLEGTLSPTEPDQTVPLTKRRSSVPYLIELPPPTTSFAPATPSPSKIPKRWSFFGLEPFVGASSPNQARSASAGSSDSQAKTAAVNEVSPEFARPASSGAADLPVLQKTVSKKRSKKQKKVKVWAGSILSRKSKARHVKHKRRSTPTPPPLRADEDEADADRASAEFLAEPPLVMITESYGHEDAHSSPPQRPASLPDEDTSFQMIDLDAALGPFNTPLASNPEWEAAQRAGGFVKRQLHSASKLNRFTGPGMHYQHRRAESAPEMVPFEGAGRFGIHQFGSSSTMADVFEEDEDEEDSTENKTTGNSTPMAETPGDKTINPLESEGKLAISSAKSDVSAVHSKRDALSPLGIMKRNGSDLPSPAPAHWERSPTATPSPRQVFRSKDLAPVEVSPLNLPASTLAPGSPYSPLTQSSSFPSPRTPVSYDTQRMSTAPSSFTDDSYRSLLMGEPGPEVRISMEGVPSLTSSTSTMTRESAFPHNPQARIPPPSNDLPRPASFSSTAFGRRRSSLASLSRLISSSHGERSKLSTEMSMDNGNDQEKKPKASKTRRLSRLMQFWRPKDGKDAATET